MKYWKYPTYFVDNHGGWLDGDFNVTTSIWLKRNIYGGWEVDDEATALPPDDKIDHVALAAII